MITLPFRLGAVSGLSCEGSYALLIRLTDQKTTLRPRDRGEEAAHDANLTRKQRKTVERGVETVNKWIVVAVVAALATVGAVAFAQQDAAPQETAQASGAKQERKNGPGSSGSVQAFVPPDLEWEDNPDVPGVQNAAGVGDPTRRQLYTSFGKIEKGIRFPAHTHPDARITTVLSGTMYFGVGEGFDQAELEPYPAGSVIYTPPNTPHVMWAKNGEIVVQETGHGPTDIELSSDPER